MVARKTTARKSSAGRKPAASKAAPAKAPARRSNASKAAAKAPAKPVATAVKDVTMYADKEPTGYHKAFARWIVDEVGYNPKGDSAQKAFLMGVSIATAARASFQSSEALEAWREQTGEAKRGPKPKNTSAKRETVPDAEFEDETDEDEVDEAAETDEDERREELEAMKLTELRALARDLDIDTQGVKKADLVEEILSAEEESEEDDEADDADADEEEEDLREELEEINIAGLRKRAREHGIKTQGVSKGELINAIVDAELSESDEDEDEDFEDEEEQEEEKPAPKSRARSGARASSGRTRTPKGDEDDEDDEPLF